MISSYRTQAFVFKKEDRQEADRNFSVFTRDFGRVEVVAKAVRKITSKLRGGIEIFCVSDIEFIQGKRKKTLTDALALERFGNIARNPEKFEVANSVAKVLDKFIRGQEIDGKMWDFLVDIFTKLNAPATNNKFLYYYFFWNFMALLGYQPELSKCAMCGLALNPKVLYFSPSEGGVVCGSCGAKAVSAKKINADTVKMLRLILKKDWETLAKLNMALASKKMVKEISQMYCRYLVGTVL